MMIELKHQEGLQFLSDISDNSVDLILTDPPYITSRDSGMDKWVDHVAKQDEAGAKNLRTVEQWQDLKTLREWVDFLKNDRSLYNYDEEGKPSELITGLPKRKLKKYKADYLKYGSIYGKKYAVKTKFLSLLQVAKKGHPKQKIFATQYHPFHPHRDQC